MSQTTAQLISSGIVAPATLSTGAPGWDSSGNLSFNSGYGSSAVAYACRAWVNFNGTTATPSTIRGSGNVSSVTKNGTGDYTVNFTTTLPNANYAAVYGGSTDWRTIGSDSQASMTTSGIRIYTRRPDNAVLIDLESIALAIFR